MGNKVEGSVARENNRFRPWRRTTYQAEVQDSGEVVISKTRQGNQVEQDSYSNIGRAQHALRERLAIAKHVDPQPAIYVGAFAGGSVAAVIFDKPLFAAIGGVLTGVSAGFVADFNGFFIEGSRIKRQQKLLNRLAQPRVR